MRRIDTSMLGTVNEQIGEKSRYLDIRTEQFVIYKVFCSYTNSSVVDFNANDDLLRQSRFGIANGIMFIQSSH